VKEIGQFGVYSNIISADAYYKFSQCACVCKRIKGPSRWPRGLRRGSAADRLLGLWVRIPPGAWMFVCLL